jgi:hypothetical protein
MYHLNIAKENALLGVKNVSIKNLIIPQLKGIKMVPLVKAVQQLSHNTEAIIPQQL